MKQDAGGTLTPVFGWLWNMGKLSKGNCATMMTCEDGKAYNHYQVEVSREVRSIFTWFRFEASLRVCFLVDPFKGAKFSSFSIIYLMKTNNHKKRKEKAAMLRFHSFQFNPPNIWLKVKTWKGFRSPSFAALFPSFRFVMKFSLEMCFFCFTHLSLHNCSPMMKLNRR